MSSLLNFSLQNLFVNTAMFSLCLHPYTSTKPLLYPGKTLALITHTLKSSAKINILSNRVISHISTTLHIICNFFQKDTDKTSIWNFEINEAFSECCARASWFCSRKILVAVVSRLSVPLES